MELCFCNIESRYINGAQHFRLSYLTTRGNEDSIYARTRELLEEKAKQIGLKLDEKMIA